MDDYIEEMIRLISNYAAKSKMIDQNFFEQLAHIVTDEKELYYYIRRINIKNGIGGPTAGYDPITGIIKLNLNAMKKEFSSLNLHAYSIPEEDLLFEYYFHACRIFYMNVVMQNNIKVFVGIKQIFSLKF